MKAKAVKIIFSHLSLFSCETPYFVIFPYTFPTLPLLRRPVHPINVSSMKNCIQPAPNTQCLHFRLLAGMKIYISKEQMCQEINPIISEYTAHLRPALVATAETYSALSPWGPSFCWHLKGITSVESLALGLGKTDCELFCPLHRKASRYKDCKGSLSPKSCSVLSQVLDHQLERKVMAYAGHILSSCSSGGRWRVRFLSLQ